MAKVINIQDAKIRTMSVGIRALTVSNKQVTLAVYRQLMVEQLVDYQVGTLHGVPWGYINVHDSSCPSDDHRHYVWQSGDELRRCTTGRGRWGTFYSDAIDIWARAVLGVAAERVLAVKADMYFKSGTDRFRYWLKYRCGRDELSKLPFRIDIKDDQDPIYVDISGHWLDIWYGCSTLAVDIEYSGPDPAALKAAALQDIREEVARRERVNSVVENLKELPQLFVAV